MPNVLGNQHQNHGDKQPGKLPVELGVLKMRQSDNALLLHGLLNGREVYLAPHNRSHIPDDHTQQNREAANNTLEQHRNQDNRDKGYERGDGRLHEVRFRTRCQVEADERHDRAGHHGRHELRQPAGTRKLHNNAHQKERQTRHDDTAERTRRTVLVRRRRQRCDKRKGRAQIRRHTPARDQQEQNGAQTREEQRGCWREPGQQRYEEGRAEHRHHMLGADADRNRPGEAFARCHDRAGFNASAVAVQTPAETGFLCAHGMRSPGEGEDKIPSNSTPVEPGVRVVKRLLM